MFRQSDNESNRINKSDYSRSNLLNLNTITALQNDLNSRYINLLKISNYKTEENFNLHHQLLMKIEDNINPKNLLNLKYPKKSKRYEVKE